VLAAPVREHPAYLTYAVGPPRSRAGATRKGQAERDAAGEVARYAGIVLDVTEQKAKLEKLAAERERLVVTLRSIGDAVIATDGACRITVLNGVAETLTGWTAAEAIGRPPHDVFRIVAEETGQPAEDPVGKVLRDGVVAGLANHTHLIARDGRELPPADNDQHRRGGEVGSGEGQVALPLRGSGQGGEQLELSVACLVEEHGERAGRGELEADARGPADAGRRGRSAGRGASAGGGGSSPAGRSEQIEHPAGLVGAGRARV
jgi:PAS domain S-box-containing protein